MSKPKLLIVGPLPPPIGGVETVTQAVLESNAFTDFQTAHCNTTKGRPKQTQGKFDLGNYFWAIRHFFRMYKSVKRFKPDIVYMPVAGTWSGFLRDGVLAKIAKSNTAKVVGHVHGSDFGKVLERKNDEQKIRRNLSYFDCLLMLGTPWKQLIIDYGFNGRVAIVPSTLRKEVYERGVAFHRKSKLSGEVIGLFLGQLGERKGVFDILKALTHIEKEGLEFRLVFVGPGELEGMIEKVLEENKKLELEDITEFTGPLMGEDLYKRFEQADFLILPSYNEGLPVVFYEAGAFELPPITTPVGAITDLVKHEINGLIVEPGNVDQIYNAMKTFITNHELRIRLGKQMKNDIADYHPDKVCEKIAKAVKDTLNS